MRAFSRGVPIALALALAAPAEAQKPKPKPPAPKPAPPAAKPPPPATPAPPPAADAKPELVKPKTGLALGQVADAQKSAERERIDAAVSAFKEERYAPAAVSLYDVATGAATPPAVKDEAEYHLAKTLYRLGLNHAALHYFGGLLARGPGSSFYGPSLEWCLFIARKIVAEDRVLDMVAKYSDGTFPQEYADEFNYLLGRHHYLKGLALETSPAAATLGEARAVETPTGGRSVKGDVFGDVFDDEPEPAQEEEVVSREGRKISLEEDIFGDEEAPKKPAPGAEPTPPKAADAALNPKEHSEAANRAVARVAPTSNFAARAKFLEAVLLYKGGRDNDALESFKSVVRLTKEGSPQEDAQLRQLAFFQLARTHFGAKQPSFAIYYYDRMQRFTEAWLEALYESSWAEFRLGNYEKALGNLLTLHSPFFRDEYFPESHVLKAVVYYENCRYKEAKEILIDFKKRYEPVLDELTRLTDRQESPEKYYEILANLREPGQGDIAEDRARIMSQILSIALSDPELLRLDESYGELTAELEALGKLGEVFDRSAAKPALMEIVSAVQAEYKARAGNAVKRRLGQERGAIKGLVQQAVRIDIETAAAEQARIESTLRDVNSRPKDVDKEYVEWADDEKLVWPFEEEYWRDELGTYELTLAHSCR